MLPPLIMERMRQDVNDIISGLSPEDRERLRNTSEEDLILFHHGFGTGLRNGFRSQRYPGLFAFCSELVQQSEEPMSFDALSDVAIREIWSTLRVRT
jgi:hypothetical protein